MMHIFPINFFFKKVSDNNCITRQMNEMESLGVLNVASHDKANLFSWLAIVLQIYLKYGICFTSTV